MGNTHISPRPNDIALLYGGGYSCDCGPVRFEPSQAAADERLLARGLGPDEVIAKVQELNVVMRKFRNPLCFILPPMFIGLVAMTTIQLHPIFVGRGGERRQMMSSFECPRGMPRTSKEGKLIWPMNEGDTRVCGEADKYHAEYCNEANNKGCFDHLVDMCCGSNNQCKWKRACEHHEAKDPKGYKCCAFYCCGHSWKGGNSMWDMKGPHQISPEWAGSKESLEECPMMSPRDRIFHLSAGSWELSGENKTNGAMVRVEPWFNETLTLDAYVEGTMDLGCRCSLRYDSQKYNPSCGKMLVVGDFWSERRSDEPHDIEGKGPSFLDYLRYREEGSYSPS